MVLSGIEEHLRRTGLRTRPQVHLIDVAGDMPYLGVVMAPDPDVMPARATMPKLGVLPAVVSASHLCVVWDNQDLSTVTNHASALLILEAGAEEVTLTVHPFDIAQGPLANTGVPGILPMWHPAQQLDSTDLPAPIRALLTVWRTPPAEDLAAAQSSLEWNGYFVSLPAARRDSLRVIHGSSNAVPASNALRAALKAGDRATIEHAVEAGQAALKSLPPKDPQLAKARVTLGTALLLRYQFTGSDADRRLGVELVRAAANESPPSIGTAPTESLSVLSAALRTEYKATGDVGVLREAIRMAEKVADTAESDIDRPFKLIALAGLLCDWFRVTAETESLERALEMGRKAVVAASGVPSRYATASATHAETLRLAFERTGNLSLLGEAITLIRGAIRTLPVGHVGATALSVSLSTSLRQFYEHTGQRASLEEAIDVAHRALANSPPDDPDVAFCYSALSLSLRLRYERHGAIDDLDQALVFARKAVYRLPRSSPYHPEMLVNAAVVLKARYVDLDEIDDLDDSISLVEQALRSIPRDDARTGPVYGNLATLLALRHTESENESDIDRAIIAAL
jgi:tetratricopeptide (TPR) repeat protein